MKRLITAAALTLLSAASAQAACPAPRADAVAVIGALHGLHAKSAGFSYAALRRAILDFQPDVMVLEVRPDELIDHAATPGRPEYPEVVWPLLKQHKIVSVPMEPGGDLFKTMAAQAGGAFDAFRLADPQGAKAAIALDDAAQAALLAYWRSPAQTQDAATAAAAAGLDALRYGLAGDKAYEIQVRWDDYMADRVTEAVAANPGRRVLVLGSWRNRQRLVQAVIPSRLVEACLAAG